MEGRRKHTLHCRLPTFPPTPHPLPHLAHGRQNHNRQFIPKRAHDVSDLPHAVGRRDGRPPKLEHSGRRGAGGAGRCESSDRGAVRGACRAAEGGASARCDHRTPRRGGGGAHGGAVCKKAGWRSKAGTSHTKGVRRVSDSLAGVGSGEAEGSWLSSKQRLRFVFASAPARCFFFFSHYVWASLPCAPAFASPQRLCTLLLDTHG